MADPELYDANIKVPDTLNQIYVPKLSNAMFWNFTHGNILDYGCGPGRTGYKFILPHVEGTQSQLYSVDISPKMVEFAGKKYPHPAISYQLGSMPDKFPFGDVQFDKVFSVNVFHLVKDISSTLEGLTHCLKPGGQIGVTTLTYQHPLMNMMAALSDSPVWGEYMVDLKHSLPEWSRCERQFADEHFRNILLQNTGLKEIYFELVYPTSVVNVEAGLDVLMSMNPCLPNVPAALIPKLREEYRKLLTSILGYPLSASTVETTAEYLCAVMEKR